MPKQGLLPASTPPGRHDRRSAQAWGFARWLVLLLAIVLLPLAPPDLARAAEGDPAVQAVSLEQRYGHWELDADIDFELHPQLRHAAERGLPLYFTANLDITRPRWWWFDEAVIHAERTWSISYNALTRQWRVGAGSLALPVASLDEALAMVRHVRGWPIMPADALSPDTTYSGRLRMQLDTSQLSRPFQVNALNSSAWALSTPWSRFTITVPETVATEEPAETPAPAPDPVPAAEAPPAPVAPDVPRANEEPAASNAGSGLRAPAVSAS